MLALIPALIHAPFPHSTKPTVTGVVCWFLKRENHKIKEIGRGDKSNNILQTGKERVEW